MIEFVAAAVSALAAVAVVVWVRVTSLPLDRDPGSCLPAPVWLCRRCQGTGKEPVA